MTRAVFLDRDNTLIHAADDVADPQDVRLIQGAASAIASLRGLGYRIVVVSNQPGVAHGRFDEAAVDAVNRRIAELVQLNSGATIDRFYYCPYHPEAELEQYRADHPWRKPSPGMIEQAAEDLRLDLTACWMIGDHLRDVAAGRAAGTRTILLQPDAPERGQAILDDAGSEVTGETDETGEPDAPAASPAAADPDGPTPHLVARSLIEAVRLIAQRPPPEKLESDTSSSTRPAAPGDPDEPAPLAPNHDAHDHRDAHDAAAADTSNLASEDAEPAPPPQAEPRPAAPSPVAARDGAETSAAAEPDTPGPPPRPHPAPVDYDYDEDDPDRQSSGIPSPPFEDEAANAPSGSHLAARGYVPSPAAIRSRDTGRPARKPAEPADSPPATDADPTLVSVLRAIQRELKSRQADYGDFSYAKMGASLCQMLAIGCVLFSLVNLGDTDTFLQWMAGAGFAQLLVITFLILHGQK